MKQVKNISETLKLIGLHSLSLFLIHLGFQPNLSFIILNIVTGFTGMAS